MTKGKAAQKIDTKMQDKGLKIRPNSWIISPRSCSLRILYIQLPYFQGVVLDELPSWFHLVAHKDGKNLIGLNRILHCHLQQCTLLRAHGGLPELFRIHFTQPFVALDAQTLFALVPPGRVAVAAFPEHGGNPPC